MTPKERVFFELKWGLFLLFILVLWAVGISDSKGAEAVWVDNRPEEGAKIISGVADDPPHPHACAFVSRGNRGQYYAHCSCVLLSPQLALTAGHCDWGGPPDDYQVNVTISPTIDPAGEWRYMVHGKFYKHPMYSKDSASHDIGMIVLDRPIRDPISERLALRWSLATGIPIYAQLPTPGLLESDHSFFTAIGYGVTNYKLDPNDSATTRRTATENYKSRETNSFKTTPGTGLGCYSDSGSGAFFQNSNVVAGILSFVDGNCDSWNQFARMDAESNLSFVRQFIPTEVQQ